MPFNPIEERALASAPLTDRPDLPAQRPLRWPEPKTQGALHAAVVEGAAQLLHARRVLLAMWAALAAAEVLQATASADGDPGPVLDKIVERCGRVLSSRSVGLFLVDDAGSFDLERVHFTPLGRALVDAATIAAVESGPHQASPIPLAGTLAALAFDQGHVVDIRDLLIDARLPAGLRVGAQRFGKAYSPLTATRRPSRTRIASTSR